VSDLEYGVVDGVGTIVLNRPERSNAFTMKMIDEWADILVSARIDAAVHVLVVRGAGDTAFCSGADLEQHYDQGPTPLRRKQNLDRIHRIPLALRELDKPVIAGINGVAIGAGMDMALMCDIRVMARSARMSEGYIRAGMVPADGACYYLPRLVGTAKALELLLTGDFIDPMEALRLGLVNQVVDDKQLADTLTGLARRIADASPLAVRATKRMTYESAEADLRTALDLASSHLAVIASTDDAREALAAFRAKRPPRFTAR
jgi:enoyl-CoA hydratase/carnithine racemase